MLLAAIVLAAALLEPSIGMFALVPLGLLLALSATGEAEPRPTVLLTTHNLGLALLMVVAFALFWLRHTHFSPSSLVMLAATVLALPLALLESAPGAARDRTIVVTRRSLILSLMALVTFVYLDQDRGEWYFALVGVCLILPLVLAASRAWAARQGRIELGLLRRPLHPRTRPHLVQALNVWVCCALLAGVVAAGGTHFARLGFSLDGAEFDALATATAAGLILLAALVLVPRRRVHVATNVVVAVVSGFLAVQLASVSAQPAGAVVLASPLAGEWFVQNGGRSILLNGHPSRESNAVDFQLLGPNGRTHTGGSDARLGDYAGFGEPVLAPADGQVVGVAEDYPDNPPGTSGDRANHVVIDIGGDRYVVLVHLEQGSVAVEVGDVVREGQPLAAVGNNGHSTAPHLHIHVQDTPSADITAERTYPMLFADVEITRGGAWPWDDSRALRTGDLVRALEP